MKNEITDLLSELMISDDADLSNCLRKEQEKLDEIKCTTPETGKWVDDFELPVLFEILDSPDSYFYKHFPELKSLSYEKRRQLAEDIQKHVEICEHCKLKKSYDKDWETKVSSTVDRHRENLIEAAAPVILKAKKSPEAAHQDGYALFAQKRQIG